MEDCVIYGIREVGTTKIRYVGQTRRGLQRRAEEHLRAAFYADNLHFPVCRWIRKQGVDRVEFVLLENLGPDPEMLDQREMFWVATLGTCGNGGLNCDNGGRGGPGVPHTPEARAKMSASRRGKVFTEEHRRKLSEAHRGESHHQWGKPRSEEVRAAISNAVRGEKNPRAVLTEAQVIEIISRLTAGEAVDKLATEFNVQAQSIHNIRKNRTWKHIPR